MTPKSISISNFKSFGSTAVKASIRPITLIFGPNSAGKSSLLQSLFFLEHALGSGELDVISPRRARGGMDLGGFAQIINRQSRLNNLAFSVSFGPELLPIESRKWLPAKDSLTLTLVLGRTGRELGCRSVSLEIDDRELLKASRTTEERFRITSIDFQHPAMRNLLATIGIGRGPNDDEYDEFLNDEERETAETYLNFLIARDCYELEMTGFLPAELGLYRHPDIRDTPSEDDHIRMTLFTDRWEDHLEHFQTTLLPEAFNAAFAAFSKKLTGFLGTLRHVPPLRDLPPRSFDLNQHSDPIWKRIGNDSEMRERINKWLTADFMKSRYKLVVREFTARDEIGSRLPRALDTQMRRLFEKQGFGSELEQILDELWTAFEPLDKLQYAKSNPDLYECLVETERDALEHYARDESFNSDYDRDFLLLNDKEKRERAEDALEEILSSDDLASTYDIIWEHYKEQSVELQQFLSENWDLDDASTAIFNQISSSQSVIRKEIALTALPSNAMVSLQDVGVGISQVLPVLMSALGEKQGTIAIEQPEIHIHPALQAELADVFIESALGENQNTFLLETHSEHLILRLLRRIRETTEGDFDEWPAALREACPKGIRPEDVAVLYVQPGDEGAEIVELPVTPDGDFDRPWPGGFFGERSKELF